MHRETIYLKEGKGKVWIGLAIFCTVFLAALVVMRHLNRLQYVGFCGVIVSCFIVAGFFLTDKALAMLYFACAIMAFTLADYPKNTKRSGE